MLNEGSEGTVATVYPEIFLTPKKGIRVNIEADGKITIITGFADYFVMFRPGNHLDISGKNPVSNMVQLKDALRRSGGGDMKLRGYLVIEAKKAQKDFSLLNNHLAQVIGEAAAVWRSLGLTAANWSLTTGAQWSFGTLSKKTGKDGYNAYYNNTPLPFPVIQDLGSMSVEYIKEDVKRIMKPLFIWLTTDTAEFAGEFARSGSLTEGFENLTISESLVKDKQ
ncbi:hypothetical protein BKA70DRAFT_1557840 [Coprinopsis sp. MPI-PUGE-AT-0042]|nr:hypothetical protein BKA70DRAFT_1557840 [Coprinopsis sp. MPI-PUGE-AT-0042]